MQINKNRHSEHSEKFSSTAAFQTVRYNVPLHPERLSQVF